jgi:hypothetical protein
VKKRLSLFATHLSICIAEDESDGGKEVTLARTIATNDDICLRGEGFDNRLFLVATIPLALLPKVQYSPYLLKPWIMICLICILAHQARWTAQTSIFP